jgi:hypothetical protein
VRWGRNDGGEPSIRPGECHRRIVGNDAIVALLDAAAS